jgi:Fe-Mn family superoxide dismutase
LSLATAVAKNDIISQLNLQQNINFNAGGHVNHTLFWENLIPSSSPNSQQSAAPKLSVVLIACFGSVEKFQEKFKGCASRLEGIRLEWLVQDVESGNLELTTSKDQDIVPAGKKTLLGIDMLGHAYYL